MPISSSRIIPPDTMITRCTCGRQKALDKLDLAVIIEEDKIRYIGRGAIDGMVSPRSLVVCLRKGCKGQWRSCKRYSDRLPRIWHKEYMRIMQ